MEEDIFGIVDANVAISKQYLEHLYAMVIQNLVDVIVQRV
jgi:hypothetical protein